MKRNRMSWTRIPMSWKSPETWDYLDDEFRHQAAGRGAGRGARHQRAHRRLVAHRRSDPSHGCGVQGTTFSGTPLEMKFARDKVFSIAQPGA